MKHTKRRTTDVEQEVLPSPNLCKVRITYSHPFSGMVQTAQMEVEVVKTAMSESRKVVLE